MNRIIIVSMAIFSVLWVMGTTIGCSTQSEQPKQFEQPKPEHPKQKDYYPPGEHIPVASDDQQPDAQVQAAAKRCAALVKPASTIKKIIDWKRKDSPFGTFVRVLLRDNRYVMCDVPDHGAIDFEPSQDVVDCASNPDRGCEEVGTTVTKSR
jgi:hypothetical protein